MKTKKKIKRSLTPDEQRTMVRDNMQLVHWFLAQKLPPYRAGLSHDDLLQEGFLGLMRAAQTFDPSRGVKFATYAVWWVKSFLQRAVKREWSEQNPFVTTHETVATTPDGPRHYPRAPIKRLDAPVPGVDDANATLGDFIADDLTSIDDIVGDVDRRAFLLRYAKLCAHRTHNPKAFMVIYNRYLAEEPMTLNDLGKMLGMSREGVRQIEVAVIAELRSLKGIIAASLAYEPNTERVLN